MRDQPTQGVSRHRDVATRYGKAVVHYEVTGPVAAINEWL